MATGFKGWGMSHGIMSGMLLRDEIIGQANPWSQLFNPNRFASFVSGEMLASNVSIVSTLVKGKITSFSDSIADLANGEARVVEIAGDKVAVYRDEGGEVHAISAVCTHMGCIATWNNAEKSWDCPCHGSRFDYDGKVLNSPAIDGLKPYQKTI